MTLCLPRRLFDFLRAKREADFYRVIESLLDTMLEKTVRVKVERLNAFWIVVTCARMKRKRSRCAWCSKGEFTRTVAEDFISIGPRSL